MNVLERLKVLEDGQARVTSESEQLWRGIEQLWKGVAGVAEEVQKLNGIIGLEAAGLSAAVPPSAAVSYENGCGPASPSSTSELAAVQDNLVEILGELRGLSEQMSGLLKPTITSLPLGTSVARTKRKARR